MPKGARVVVVYAGANRDPKVWGDDPDRFDPDRPNLKDHLAFGKGIHFCIGAPLSRLELQLAFEHLADASPTSASPTPSTSSTTPASCCAAQAPRRRVHGRAVASNLMSEQGVIERVGVVGCGLMGSGIAEVSARAGLDVVVREVDAGRRRGGPAPRDDQPRSGCPLGQADRGDRDESLSRMRWTTDLADLADRDLVVEAVVEDEALKTEVFAALDKVVDSARAILASNTSSIPIMKLGMATSRPEQVVGIHFFNPVPVLRLVEVVTSLLTSPETTERASTFATDVLTSG